jgi:hypothetical protein
VVAPIDIGERIVAGVALIAAIALFRWLWDALSATSGTVPIGLLNVAWAAMAAACAVLAGAVFFAFRNMFHTEVSS